MSLQSQNNIRDAAYASISSISKKWPDLIQEDVAKTFIDLATKIGDFDHYKYFPEAAKKIITEIQSTHGLSATKTFTRGILLHAIIDLIEKKSLEGLPATILKHQSMHLYRIANDTETESDWLDISHDIFQKEFGITTLRLFSAGAQLIDVRCGIPRSILLKNGLGNVYKNLALMIKLGGFKPFFQIHTHKLNLDQFHEEGWNECYRGCAELYEIIPKSLGMFGSSWFYDPALDSISPRLNYLRQTPIEGGANLIFYSEGGDAIDNSIATSSTRRELYEAGKYMPKSYMLIWGKEAQKKWALDNTEK